MRICSVLSVLVFISKNYGLVKVRWEHSLKGGFLNTIYVQDFCA